MPTNNSAAFVERVCLPFLRLAQNSDGGWGFRPGANSRIEATAWALLALEPLESEVHLRRSAANFLRSSQLADGSWPAATAQTQGCWVSSLALQALANQSESQAAISAGLWWLCRDKPRDVNIGARLLRKVSLQARATQHNESLYGWGWTTGTASWVEPTAFALMAMDRVPRELLPCEALERGEMARGLLYDRMCREGGWNCGNPAVYGVTGDPLIEPTAWALLALRDEANRSENVLSLEWLEKGVAKTLGPGSLAVAKICFDAYGRQWPDDAPNFESLYERNGFFEDVRTMAWTCMALSPPVEPRRAVANTDS